MDSHFQKLLHRAESTRAECRLSGYVSLHASIMVEMIKYGQDHGLLVGNALEGTASEENLAIAVEGAAMIVENTTRTSLGLVHDRAKEEKIELIRLAKQMAEFGIFSI